MPTFTPQNINHHHQNHLECCITGFLYQYIYNLQYIPEDGSFYLICIQSKHLTLLLHCNKCSMERRDHGNLSYYVLYTFPAYHEYIYSPLLQTLLLPFQRVEIQPHSVCFDNEAATPVPQKN